ncbi:unnamed protein product [Echinostoma caproni]|uniref:PINc domain-containing protein n=1 Tax=Echinostoma caproni TaxID=27848 RepID=A0A183A6T9_9TREM|nr:unnamed protein product [Echinostoma caproni]
MYHLCRKRQSNSQRNRKPSFSDNRYSTRVQPVSRCHHDLTTPGGNGLLVTTGLWCFKVLLVFPKADKQTKFLIDATAKLNYHCSLMLLNYAALTAVDKNQAGQKANSWLEQVQLDRPIDLVIIDRRRGLSSSSSQTRSSNNLTQAADLIRQTLSVRPEFSHAVIAALIPLRSSVEEAERELTAFVHNELRLIRRCREIELSVNGHKETVKEPRNQVQLLINDHKFPRSANSAVTN